MCAGDVDQVGSATHSSGTELPLVDLRGAAALSRIGQDAWLSAGDEEDYPLTQEWATAVRRWAPRAAGLVWMSKRDHVHEAVVLFSDRIRGRAITGTVVRALDSPLGVSTMSKTLAEFNVALG